MFRIRGLAYQGSEPGVIRGQFFRGRGGFVLIFGKTLVLKL
jgi:hypothetical protein